MLKWFLTFLACLVQEKKYIKCLLASLKTLTNYRNCTETRCYYGFPLVHFLKCTFIKVWWHAACCMAGFSLNNFQDNRQLSEQLLESQAAGTSFLNRVTGRFLQSVTDHMEASRNFILDILHKKTAKRCENNQCSYRF